MDRMTHNATTGGLARATVNLFQKWGLTDREACVLLGGISVDGWHRLKDGDFRHITQEQQSRMAILMSIHQGLRYLFRDPTRGYAWIRKPNAIFEGISALDVMMRGSVGDLTDVRDYLDADRA